MKGLLKKVARFFRHHGVRKVDTVLDTLNTHIKNLEDGISGIDVARDMNVGKVRRSLEKHQALVTEKSLENQSLENKRSQAVAVRNKLQDLLK